MTSTSTPPTTVDALQAQLFGEPGAVHAVSTPALIGVMLDAGTGISDLIFSPGRPPQIERHGQLVSKDELLEAVWPRVVVTEGSLTQCLVDIRCALGDESQTVIRTIPRRGYMFDAPLIEADPGVRDGAPTLPVESSPPTVDPPALVAGGSAPARPRWLALALIGFGCVAVSLAWFAITRRDASEPST